MLKIMSDNAMESPRDNVERMVTNLTESQLKIAEDELCESDSAREEKLKSLRKWIEDCNVNVLYKFDDVSLLWFLRGCKFDLVKAQIRIENFQSFRLKVPEWYADRDPCKPELLELVSLGMLLPLRGRDQNGNKITYIRACFHDPYKHKQDNVFKVMNMVVDLMCRDDEAISVTGVVAIVDLAGVSFGHAMQMTPSMIRKAVNSWQDVTPIRTKGMYFINTPYNAHVILNVFKKFMKEKLRQRVHAYGNGRQGMQSLVSVDHLPEDFGGKGPSLQDLTEEWKEKMVQNRDWFLSAKEHGPFSY